MYAHIYIYIYVIIYCYRPALITKAPCYRAQSDPSSPSMYTWTPKPSKLSGLNQVS